MMQVTRKRVAIGVVLAVIAAGSGIFVFLFGPFGVRDAARAGHSVPAAGAPGSGTAATDDPLPAPAPSVADVLAMMRDRSPEAARSVATVLRRRSLEDHRWIKALSETLASEEADDWTRRIAAYVLGSLPGPSSRSALADALKHAQDPGWQIVLIRALGMNRTVENPFAIDPGEPNVLSDPVTGIDFLERHAFSDGAVLGLLLSFAASDDLEVRRAVQESLQHTLSNAARMDPLAPPSAVSRVREAFMARLGSEPDEGLRAAVARPLAEWFAAAPASEPAAPEVESHLLDSALDPTADMLRLRIEQGLSRASLSATSVDRLVAEALEGGYDSRSWAMDVLGGQISRMGGTGKDRVLGALAAGLQDSDGKIRETSARVLGRIGDAATLEPLLIATDDAEWNVRVAAVRALGSFPGHAEARAVVERIGQSDENEAVRRAASTTATRMSH